MTPDSPVHIREGGTPSRCILLLAGLLLLAGCATSGSRHSSDAHRTVPHKWAEEREELLVDDDGGGFGFWNGKKDDFQLLQQSAGLEKDVWHEAGEELEADAARRLWESLIQTPTTLRNFGPKRALFLLLRQVLMENEDVPYAELMRRLRAFRPLVAMRPDGYLVTLLTGEPLQSMGKVKVREGRLMVGSFEVGTFYRNKGGVFYPVDDALKQSDWRSLGELGLERDWLNAALDGSEDVLVEVVLALDQLLTDPVRSLRDLTQLPAALAALIASSPEYFARYATLPLQEQIQEAGRLSTHLLMLFGSAGGTATRIGTAGTRLPVLSLTAEGALAIEQVAVPVGTSSMVLGAGAGAVYVLSSAAKPPDDNSAAAPARSSTQSFGGLSRASEFGVRPQNELRQAIQGSGLQAHHLIEQRFAAVMGEDARQKLCVAVTPAEHQAFTNAWRAAIPYGEGTANVTKEMIMREAARIYADYPAILQALGL
jgi:hypothetical protein